MTKIRLHLNRAMFRRHPPVESHNGSVELAKQQAESQPVSAEVAADLAGEELLVTYRERDPRLLLRQADNCAARSLAAGRRTIRLLWLALVLSIVGHLIVPICLVSVLQHPEKVALMDGTQSLIIAPLVPIEQSREILETISYWAAKSYLDRGPQGFDAPDTLERVFLPGAYEKAKSDFNKEAPEFARKNIHQKLEIGRIDLQNLGDSVYLSRVVGQILTQAQVGDEQVVQPQPVTLNLKLVRNPYLGRNQRYPFAVSEYSFGQTEQLNLQTTDKK
ncbi:MAG: hypothetical protein JO331_14335 [Verrucomicrobia bacterium]|nr:hypothetical protein [Verrucomicrobiota bacterium]